MTLREKCPYSALLWSAFSRTRTEYGEILQNNSKYEHLLRSVVQSRLSAAVANINVKSLMAVPNLIIESNDVSLKKSNNDKTRKKGNCH